MRTIERERQIRKHKLTTYLFFAVLLVIGYLAIGTAFNNQQSSVKPEEPKNVGTQPNENKKTPTPKSLVYRLNIPVQKAKNAQKPVIEIRKVDLDGNNKKLIFTDMDEDFQIRLISSIPNNLLFFATTLNETTGAIWQIGLSETLTKKQIISDFSSSAFSSNNEKILYVIYDNVGGKYALWSMNMDGRYKSKILESDSIISDPVFIDKTIAFVKIDSQGNGILVTSNLDGSNQKEIAKGNKESIYGLSYAASKLAYVKAPITPGQENLAEIYIYNLQSQKESRITNDKKPDSSPVLSKIGDKIAFCKNNQIWLGNTDGSDQKSLVEGTQPIEFIE
ncbi:MAG: DUF5050 domain-containing protein [Candidatus Berkelbacteria bacterium]|nr:DUF5050 domain-containing protein [Candidatus Berkelbacteria bacterium]